jgi:hypothetical protein
MKSLANARGSEFNYPLDVEKKESQQTLRDLLLKGVEEIFESLQHFKNWKSHRITGDSSFSREDFLEEMIDAFNYMFSVLILLGYSEKEVIEMYEKKHQIILKRIKDGY